jgi:hypothetical protein
MQGGSGCSLCSVHAGEKRSGDGESDTYLVALPVTGGRAEA